MLPLHSACLHTNLKTTCQKVEEIFQPPKKLKIRIFWRDFFVFQMCDVSHIGNYLMLYDEDIYPLLATLVTLVFVILFTKS